MNKQYYIEYLNSSRGFKQDKKFFTSPRKAEMWGRKYLSNFSLDMIKIY